MTLLQIHLLERILHSSSTLQKIVYLHHKLYKGWKEIFLATRRMTVSHISFRVDNLEFWDVAQFLISRTRLITKFLLPSVFKVSYQHLQHILGLNINFNGVNIQD